MRDVRTTPPAATDGILASRPRDLARSPARPGTHPIEAGTGRGLLHVPRDYDVSRPAALIVTLHGAGGTAGHGLGPLLGRAEDGGVLLLAPTSARATWDAIGGAHGPDVAAIDELLDRTFAT